MTEHTDDELRTIYDETTVIAVVGASTTVGKPSHRIPAYLRSQGFTIIGVNPSGGEFLGAPMVTSLSEIDEHVDVVDVFRPAEETPEIAREAVAIGADVLWLQQGISSEEAARIAREGGLDVVMDICMGATHARLGIAPKG
jgi:predicted CoA-binding protein